MMLTEMLPEHLARVKKLLDLCFGHNAWSEKMIAAQMEKPDSRCLIAAEDERIVGFLAFEQIADEGSIIEVAVDPDFRRRGIARSLIKSVLEHADGLAVVFLEVRAGNFPAIALYESLGFAQISVRKDYYDDPKENAVIMKYDGVVYENTCNRKQL